MWSVDGCHLTQTPLSRYLNPKVGSCDHEGSLRYCFSSSCFNVLSDGLDQLTVVGACDMLQLLLCP